MQLKMLTCLLATSVWFPAMIAQGSEIDVRAGNVRITTTQDGRTYVNSGQTRIYTPPTRSYYGVYPKYRRYIGVRCPRGGNMVRQESFQGTYSGGTVMRHHLYSQNCY